MKRTPRLPPHLALASLLLLTLAGCGPDPEKSDTSLGAIHLGAPFQSAGLHIFGKRGLLMVRYNDGSEWRLEGEVHAEAELGIYGFQPDDQDEAGFQRITLSPPSSVSGGFDPDRHTLSCNNCVSVRMKAHPDGRIPIYWEITRQRFK